MLYKNSIPIGNIYYMLAYAYRDLSEQSIVSVDTEEFDNIQKLMAQLLINGVEYQLKKGLFKNYEYKSEELYTVRGRIDITGTMNRNGFRYGRYICEHDDYTTDTLMNRIIKSVMLLLIKADIYEKQKKILCNFVRYFSEISAANLLNVNWNAFNFNRNNKSYRFLMSICRVICENMLFSTESGELKIIDFTDDDLNRLYEKFILNYFIRHHSNLSPNPSKIKWAVTEQYPLLPEMQTDTVLFDKERKSKLIIDAKFYSKPTAQKNENYREKFHSHNLYQIFTYVKNEIRNFDGTVSGMLLYANTQDNIIPLDGLTMDIDGNKFYVNLLDLSGKFSDISAQLDKIAENFPWH